MKKSLLIILFGITFLLHAECDKMVLVTNGNSLYKYVTKIGWETFSEGTALNALENLLSDYPTIKPLEETDLKSWNKLTECASDATDKMAGRDSKTIAYKNATARIEDTTKSIVLFSEDLLRTKIFEQLQNKIKAISDSFIFSLNQLPKVNSFYKRSPESVIQSYERSGATFNPKTFFDVYIQIKKDLVKKGNFNAENIFIFLQAAKVLNPIKSDIKNKLYENRQNVATEFVTMLEELQFQSKQYQSFVYRFRSKPYGTLSEEQSKMADEIINALYTLFPMMNTKTIRDKIKDADNNYKTPLLLFAQSRVLLTVLHAYYRSAQVQQRKKGLIH